jgi:DNA glycosylase AlkZ-like
MTRSELAASLRARRLPHEGTALAHVLMAAELERRIISGPLRSKRFTYMAFEQRAPLTTTMSDEQAAAALALRYFRGHGPATARDFAWWSGLTLHDARAAVSAVGRALNRIDGGGEQLWTHAEAPDAGDAASVHLLRNFDEYTVGYADRSVLLAGRTLERSLFAFGSELANVVIIRGRIAGAWSRTLSDREARIELRVPGRVAAGVRRRLMVAAERHATHLGRSLSLVWN